MDHAAASRSYGLYEKLLFFYDFPVEYAALRLFGTKTAWYN
jgi:hypothetical protein